MSQQPNLAPHSIDAEEAVLGSILLNPDAFLEVLPFLRSDDFFLVRHGWIWDAMMSLHERKDPIDHLTAINELEQSGKLAEVGGAAYLISLISRAPSGLNVEGYGRIIERMALRRRLIEAAQVVARVAHSDETDIDQVVEQAHAAIEEVTDRRSGGADTTRTAHDIAGDVLVDAMMWRDNPAVVRGYASGLGPVDEMMGGYQPGELTAVLGRPGQGKSALLAQLGAGFAKNKYQTLLFSLEMSAGAMLRRMGCQIAHISATRLKQGGLSRDEFKRFQDAMETLGTYPLWVEARSGLTVRDMKTIARKYERKYGLAVIMIDTFNRVVAEGDKQYEKTTDKSHAIADWAHEPGHDYTIIEAVQLSRVNETTADKRPTLNAIRDSGAVEEDLDNALGLYRPFYYDRDNEAVRHDAELRILKFRDGDSDAQADLYWRAECVSFERSEKKHYDLNDAAPVEYGGTHAAWAAGKAAGR